MAIEWLDDAPKRAHNFLSADGGRRTLSELASGAWWWQARTDGQMFVYGTAPTREEAEARIALVLPLLDAAHTAIKAALWERDIAAKALGMSTEVAS